MLHPTKNRRSLRRFALTLAAAATSVGAVACAGDKGAPAAPPQFPGLTGPAAAVKPVAFIADINVHNGTIRITSPSSNTLDKTSLSMLGGKSHPTTNWPWPTSRSVARGCSQAERERRRSAG